MAKSVARPQVHDGETVEAQAALPAAVRERVISIGPSRRLRIWYSAGQLIVVEEHQRATSGAMNAVPEEHLFPNAPEWVPLARCVAVPCAQAQAVAAALIELAGKPER